VINENKEDEERRELEVEIWDEEREEIERLIERYLSEVAYEVRQSFSSLDTLKV
jgi:hypothetical protein